MNRWCIASVALTLSIAAVPAFGQSLAELARQEEARRLAAPKAKKTYTNVDLGPGAVPEAAPAEDTNCYQSKSEGKCVTAEEMVANSAATVKTVEDAPREEPIRKLAGTLRDELASIQKELDSLEAQVANQSSTPARRQQATEQLALKRPTLDGFQRRWARLERQIKENKLPHSWIEPVPPNALPQQ